jgi:hypothetical protein
MRAKPSIFGYLLIQLLIVAGAKYCFSASAAQPAAIGQERTTQLKSIPEDTVAWKREPFRSSGTAKRATNSPLPPGSAGATSDLALQGIMKSNKRYYAIINGRTVKAGDQVDGWTVVEIGHYRVTVRRDSEMHIYDIYQGRMDRGNR